MTEGAAYLSSFLSLSRSVGIWSGEKIGVEMTTIVFNGCINKQVPGDVICWMEEHHSMIRERNKC